MRTQPHEANMLITVEKTHQHGALGALADKKCCRFMRSSSPIRVLSASLFVDVAILSL